MKFWQKKKQTFDITETDQVYKVVYLGNVVTSWAKGEHTLEKPLTALWRNYCNNYANYQIKNGDNKKTKQVQNKQILMKLTICNQGLKALTREFGLTEYWANRITFSGCNSNFPRVFAWIYRHEAKQKKQELRVHACFVNSQSNVNKMITTLQQKVNFALNEFRREKRLKENARKILSMNESLNLDDVEEDKTDSEFFNEFVDRLYSKMNGHDSNNKLKDDLSINSSERMIESANTSNNTSKNSTLDSKKITRNPSQGSLNSIKSKGSTASRKSNNYDNNLMPVRRQFLVKGLKNFKEPIERSRSAPKLTSIEEEFCCSTEEEDEEEPYHFNKLINNNFVNYNFYNICEESDDETIIKELGLISDLNEQEDDLNELEDKTLTEFNEQDLVKLTPILTADNFNGTLYDNENEQDSWNLNSLNSLNRNEIINQLDFNHSNSVNTDEAHSDSTTISKLLDDNTLPINNSTIKDKEELTDKKELTTNDSESSKLSELSSNDDRASNRSSDKSENIDNKSLESTNLVNEYNRLNELNESNLYDSPSFIVCDKMRIYKKANPFNSKECNLHAKQIVDNCKLIKELVLNF